MRVIWTALALTLALAANPADAQTPAPRDPLVAQGQTQAISAHVHVITDQGIGLVPNIGIIVGAKAALVVDTGLGARNGDRVLAEFAQIFSESADTDVCGRWGGDEFVAILPLREDAAVRQIFERIEVRTAAWSHSNGLPMAVSLGVSHAPRDGHDLVTLLSVADIHLYQSKSQQSETAAAPPNYRTLIDEPEAT